MSPKSNSIYGRLANQLHNSDSLFFNGKLSREAIHQACKAMKYSFRSRIYNPAVTIWMFIGQVLSVDHSCRDAITRLNVWRVAQGMPPCDSDTSSYCEARQRLPEELVLKLSPNPTRTG